MPKDSQSLVSPSFFLTIFLETRHTNNPFFPFGLLIMKKATTNIFVLFFFLSSFSQKDSVEVLFAFRITDYQVKLNDSVTVVQINLPDAIPLSIYDKQLGIVKHRYMNGTLDTSLIGWGRCHLIKGNYYYFAINKYHADEPEQGDLLYTKCKTPVYYKSLLFDINRHAVSLITVDDNQFYHVADLFQLNQQKEKALLDSMVADIRFTGAIMKKQMPEQNQLIEGGLFNRKKLFDAMQITTKNELEEFLKYMVARPERYAGNTWKLSEIYATWMINKTPQVIAN